MWRRIITRWSRVAGLIWERLPRPSLNTLTVVLRSPRLLLVAMLLPFLPIGRVSESGIFYPTGPKVRPGTAYRWVDRRGAVVYRAIHRDGSLRAVPAPLGALMDQAQLLGLGLVLAVTVLGAWWIA